MTAGAHDAGGGFGRSAGANVARGVMVIVGAVIIGLLLMNRGLGDTQAEADAGETLDASGSAENTDGDAAPADSETPAVTSPPVTDPPVTLGPPRDPSEVAALVINGTAGEDGQPLTGVASRGTDALKTKNYITRDPKNASAPGPSVIYYIEGFEAEALAVATLLDVADASAVVRPLDPASPPLPDLQEANVVVFIGNDGLILV